MKDEAFVRLFAGSGRRELGDGLELCVVPAFAVLQARREALDACGDDAQALGIWMNVCLLARAIYRDGARAFSGGEALMRAADRAVDGRLCGALPGGKSRLQRGKRAKGDAGAGAGRL